MKHISQTFLDSKELTNPVAGRTNTVTGGVSARDNSGYSVIEILIVVALIGVLCAMAIPQIVAERRLSRTVAMTREVLSQMRYARQQAMSQRQAFTFQYNDTTKWVSVIDHNVNSGAALLISPGFPNNPGSTVVASVPLATGGLIASEIRYGIPVGVPTGPLRDGAPMTALNGNLVNITFQPDGSVIDTTGDPDDCALFFYNSSAPRGTASAVSILGASGRVKIWRYNLGANVYND
jgi:prepilin-type N-terminal cleavage/methylation domain-containing protein